MDPSNGNDGLDKQNGLLEQHIQTFLSENLDELRIGHLELIQTEYKVEFGPGDVGRIDILAKNGYGYLIVIECKRGVAKREAVAQLQSYMGAISECHDNQKVIGVLVAESADQKAKAAMQQMGDRMVFFEYEISFKFRTDFRAPSVTKLREGSKTTTPHTPPDAPDQIATTVSAANEAPMLTRGPVPLKSFLSDPEVNAPNHQPKAFRVTQPKDMASGNKSYSSKDLNTENGAICSKCLHASVVPVRAGKRICRFCGELFSV